MITLGPWPKGVVNNVPVNAVPKDALVTGNNIDLDDDGNPHVRSGLRKIYDGPIVPGTLFEWANSYYFVSNNQLVSLSSGGTAYSSFVISTGISHRPMAYVSIAGALYYTNGVNSGKVGMTRNHSTWGVPTPPSAPELVPATRGNLLPGDYEVTITWIMDAGNESGAPLSNHITLVDGQRAIDLRNIPQPPLGSGVRYVGIYLTAENGTALRWHNEIPVDNSRYLINSVTNGPVLETQFYHPLPAGADLAYSNGRMFVANGHHLFYSESLNYGLHRPDQHFISLPEPITLIVGNDGGVYVCTQYRTFWLSGIDTDSMALKEIEHFGAIPGSKTRVKTSHVVAWLTEQGVAVGSSTGQIELLTEATYKFEQSARASIAWRESNNFQQLIVAGVPADVD